MLLRTQLCAPVILAMQELPVLCSVLQTQPTAAAVTILTVIVLVCRAQALLTASAQEQVSAAVLLAGLVPLVKCKKQCAALLLLLLIVLLQTILLLTVLLLLLALETALCARVPLGAGVLIVRKRVQLLVTATVLKQAVT
jgi:hypothetical protein